MSEVDPDPSVPAQLELPFRRRGGARRGAGRKPRPEREGMRPHVPREAHRACHPVHVTVGTVSGAPSLRSERVFDVLRSLLALASAKGFRLLQFSVQEAHLQLIVEANDDQALARGIQRLLSRSAMMLNALLRRSGRLWSDRYRREPLTTPRQVRRALVHVLFDDRTHEQAPLAAFDMCSSALWFDGYVEGEGPSVEAREHAGPAITVAPSTWLARRGWRKDGGAIDPAEALRRSALPI